MRQEVDKTSTRIVVNLNTLTFSSASRATASELDVNGDTDSGKWRGQTKKGESGPKNLIIQFVCYLWSKQGRPRRALHARH